MWFLPSCERAERATCARLNELFYLWLRPTYLLLVPQIMTAAAVCDPSELNNLRTTLYNKVSIARSLSTAEGRSPRCP